MFFMFIPIWGNDPILTNLFSNGLKPPPSYIFAMIYLYMHDICIHIYMYHPPLSYPIWGGGRKNVTVQYFFAFPPPHFSKILENWRGGKKSNKCCGRISQVFDPPPPLKDMLPFLSRGGDRKL